MELSSLTCIFLFIPLYVISVFFTNKKKLFSLVFSLVFYILVDIKYFLLLILIILLTYIFSKKVKGNKLYYFIYLISVILVLSVFKFGNSLQEYLINRSYIAFVMPVGISYYLFEAISYISDVYRNKYESCDLLTLAAYISFFPTIISGPIIRFDAFVDWLKNENRVKISNVSAGVREFILGLGKKIIIANQLFIIVDYCYNKTSVFTMPLAWIGLFAFISRLYFDFSGCSNMAIGVAKAVGYEIPKNFDNPYSSKTVSEFYRRWHISLGNFFKDYVYIPMGGNRVSKIRKVINILVVWILTGLWHGSSLNYLLWGMFLGIYIVIEKNYIINSNLPDFCKKCLTVIAICFSWLIFSAENVRQIVLFINEMFCGKIIISGLSIYYGIITMLSVLMMTNFFNKEISKLSIKFRTLTDLLLILVLIVSIVLIVCGSLVTSMYANF